MTSLPLEPFEWGKRVCLLWGERVAVSTCLRSAPPRPATALCCSSTLVQWSLAGPHAPERPLPHGVDQGSCSDSAMDPCSQKGTWTAHCLVLFQFSLQEPTSGAAPISAASPASDCCWPVLLFVLIPSLCCWAHLSSSHVQLSPFHPAPNKHWNLYATIKECFLAGIKVLSENSGPWMKQMWMRGLT